MSVLISGSVGIAYWLGLAQVVACIAPLIDSFTRKSKKELYLDAFCLGAILVSVLQNFTLLIGQGTYERLDGVHTVFGRWAYEIVATIFFAGLAGQYLNMVKITKIILSALAGGTIGAVLLASISTEGGRIYTWFAVACIMYVFTCVVMSIFPTIIGAKLPGHGHAIKGVVLSQIGCNLVVFLLGHAATKVIDLTTETYLMLALDCVRTVVCVLVVTGFFKTLTYAVAGSKKEKEENIPLTHNGHSGANSSNFVY
jgi:hypothetical protein